MLQLLALVEEIGNTVNVYDVIVDHQSLIIEPIIIITA